MRKQNLADLSNDKIKEAIEAMRKGLEIAKPGSQEAKILQTSIDRALEELTRRGIKNGEGQPVKPKPDPMPEKQSPKPEREPAPAKESRQSEEKPDPVLIADALTPEPATTIPVRWARGDVKEMTQGELRQKAKDYFRDILRGGTQPKDFEQLTQFHNCVRFLIGLYRFGNDLLPHLTLHPTYNACGEAMQERSAELYRQIAEKWKEFKDVL